MQDWVKEVTDKYTSGVAIGFILHLNVFDYVEPNVSLRTYLASMLADRKIIAVYNRAEGISFPLATMKELFIKVLNIQPDPLTGQVDIPRAPAQALPLLEQLLKLGKPEEKLSAVIIEYAESLLPAADMAMMIPEDRNTLVMIERWGRDPDITAAGNPVFLITANISDLHQSVRAASAKFEAIRLPIPNLAARAAFVKMQWENEANSKAPTIKWEVDQAAVARSTAGLSLVNIEDIFLRARQEGKLTWTLITERKKDIMKSEFGEVLEVVEPSYGFEAVGGLQHVKDFFVKNVINPIKAGNYKRVPMGILMTGPAGTGKTCTAIAVAKESGINMAILNPAKIFSKWVGESERNLERALEAIDSLAPIMVFIDEIDASMPSRNEGGQGDSGTSSRIFKRMLEYMSETSHRGRVIFLAATNRPDLIDAALKRPGRFDVKIPFLVPDAKCRRDIFDVMTRKYGLPEAQRKKSDSGKFWPAVLESTDGWTGAEIERVTIKALSLVQDRNLSYQEAVLEALKYVLARTQDIERMTRLAIDSCDDLEFIPKEYWPNERRQGKVRKGRSVREN